MSVSNVSNNQISNTYTSTAQQTASASAADSNASNQSAQATAKKEENTAAVYEKSNESNKSNKSSNAANIARMIEESNQKVESMKNMLRGLLSAQADKDGKAKGIGKQSALNSLKKGIANGDDVMVEVSAEVRAKAAEDVSEDGYYGVKQTAGRILDFAKALVEASGGSPEMIDKMEKAVKEGFKQAADMWGEEMPQITSDTYDAVMKGFDEWRQSLGVSK